ncbi:hypothetical protein CKF96_02945 (plasmid) [Priestia filamentosa]|nr:hypothetical protein CKF96_02945 [Priestia filamentosa]
MTAKIVLFICLILPWFTLFFASSRTIKRFMPVTIFTCFLMTIIFQIAFFSKKKTIYITGGLSKSILSHGDI